uniref:DEP domain-containing protein n=1 Tax=Globodera rostochiensis TaxID=31243 RepID=A0A914IA49_GLORO
MIWFIRFVGLPNGPESIIRMKLWGMSLLGCSLWSKCIWRKWRPLFRKNKQNNYALTDDCASVYASAH